jgi:hypothetical protein
VQVAALAHLTEGPDLPLFFTVAMEKSVIDLVGTLCNKNQALEIFKAETKSDVSTHFVL